MKPTSSTDNQLRLFVAVAKASSLREAADVEGMTQPGISKQIRALEVALGKRLFLRHGRGMRLTPDGHRLFVEAEPLLNALDAVVERAGFEDNGAASFLRVATVQTLVPSFIPTLAAELLKAFPMMHLSTHCGSSSDVVECIERDRADIGFVYDSAVDVADMFSVPLFDEKLALYARADMDGSSHGKAASLGLLREAKLILPPRSYAIRRMVEQALGGAVRPCIECDSLELSLRLVSIGGGVTVLPDGLPQEMVELRGLNRFALPAFAPRRVVALARRHHLDSPLFNRAVSIAVGLGSVAAIA